MPSPSKPAKGRRNALATVNRSKSAADAVIDASGASDGAASASEAGAAASAAPSATRPRAEAKSAAPVKEAETQFPVRMPDSLHKRLRRAAFERDEPMLAIALRGIEAELDRIGF